MALFLPLDTLCVCQTLFLHLSQAPDSFFLPKILLDYNNSGFPDWIYTRYNFDRLNLSINEENNNIYKDDNDDNDNIDTDDDDDDDVDDDDKINFQ